MYGSKWKETIQKELSALVSFQTWNVIPWKEADGMISSTRWVFDVKLGLDDQIDHFRARLVVRGNKQLDDDFDETFALVFRLDSLQILIAIAARYGMVAHMLDGLDKSNCMEIPEGLQDFDPDVSANGVVLELKKSLYGLECHSGWDGLGRVGTKIYFLFPFPIPSGLRREFPTFLKALTTYLSRKVISLVK